MRKLIAVVTAAVAALITAGAQPALAQTQLVIISGLGGDSKYKQEFATTAHALAKAARERAKLADSAIAWLGESPTVSSPWYRGQSQRENVERLLARLAARPDSNEQVVLVLIGHGAGEGEETRLSLPGADLTAADFARLLAPLSNRRVAFVNLTSASGDMLRVLAAPNRVVMTATKSAFERNESQFGRFFVDAFAQEGADADKDGRISLLEAFRYAEAETKRFYDDQGRLATEHAQMADESQLARRFYLASGRLGGGATDSHLSALYAERYTLDEQIQALKKKKAELDPASYERELERLLLDLARKAREIRKLERGA